MTAHLPDVVGVHSAFVTRDPDGRVYLGVWLTLSDGSVRQVYWDTAEILDGSCEVGSSLHAPPEQRVH